MREEIYSTLIISACLLTGPLAIRRPQTRPLSFCFLSLPFGYLILQQSLPLFDVPCQTARHLSIFTFLFYFPHVDFYREI